MSIEKILLERAEVFTDNSPCVADLAWFAGLFDGEGYIGILPSRKNRYNSYHLVIGINMTHYATIKHIRSVWGFGSVNLIKQAHIGKDGCSRKALWRWCVGPNQSLQVLMICYPYLVTKKEQAIQAISFQFYKQRPRTWGFRKCRPIIENEVEETMAKNLRMIREEVV